MIICQQDREISFEKKQPQLVPSPRANVEETSNFAVQAELLNRQLDLTCELSNNPSEHE